MTQQDAPPCMTFRQDAPPSAKLLKDTPPSAIPSKDAPPGAMTQTGLRFLHALAAQRRSGCFLEIGPLFGASTCAIASGRRDPNAPIHTIDTFEPAPWVRTRFGRDISRAAFDGFTHHIDALTVHQGFAPDTVRDTWTDPIGFYFDDATHGDPGWSDNYTFFARFFTDDAIVCGDDFAGGWPDIVRNVSRITERLGVRLYVVGRVWAFSRKDDERIANAVHDAFPRLKGSELEVRHGPQTHRNHAASWSWGLHQPHTLTQAALHSAQDLQIGVTIHRTDGTQGAYTLGCGPAVDFGGVQRLDVSVPDGFALQFCVRDARGRTQNTRDLTRTCRFALPEGGALTALRLSHP